MKFTYYYKMYNGDTEVHEYEVFAANQELANQRWAMYKQLHSIVDVTKEELEKKKQVVNERQH